VQRNNFIQKNISAEEELVQRKVRQPFAFQFAFQGHGMQAGESGGRLAHGSLSWAG